MVLFCKYNWNCLVFMYTGIKMAASILDRADSHLNTGPCEHGNMHCGIFHAWQSLNFWDVFDQHLKITQNDMYKTSTNANKCLGKKKFNFSPKLNLWAAQKGTSEIKKKDKKETSRRVLRYQLLDENARIYIVFFCCGIRIWILNGIKKDGGPHGISAQSVNSCLTTW